VPKGGIGDDPPGVRRKWGPGEVLHFKPDVLLNPRPHGVGACRFDDRSIPIGAYDAPRDARGRQDAIPSLCHNLIPESRWGVRPRKAGIGAGLEVRRGHPRRNAPGQKCRLDGDCPGPAEGVEEGRGGRHRPGAIHGKRPLKKEGRRQRLPHRREPDVLPVAPLMEVCTRGIEANGDRVPMHPHHDQDVGIIGCLGW
jgi:hypothetical protein